MENITLMEIGESISLMNMRLRELLHIMSEKSKVRFLIFQILVKSQKKNFRFDFLIFFKGSSGGKRGRLLTMFAPEQIRMLGPTNEPLYLVVCISIKKKGNYKGVFYLENFLVLDTFLPFTLFTF